MIENHYNILDIVRLLFTAYNNSEIDFESHDHLPEEKETYQIGEDINEKIKEFLMSGIDKGDLKIMPTIFVFWGMLSGLIQFAANKEEYIKKAMGLSKTQFLEYGFHMLYCSIADKGV